MRWIKIGTLFAAICSLFFTANAMAQEWANLEGAFIYDGEAPDPLPIRANAGRVPFCMANGKLIFAEAMVVNWLNRGIRNVVFSLDVKDVNELKIHPDLANVPKENVAVEIVDCTFTPHVIVMRAGQTLTVNNRDRTGHNANFGFFQNAAINLALPNGGSADLKIAKPETGPVPVECNIHPWMKCYVAVKDHPYVSVSDEDGRFLIKGLPAGEPLTFRVWHENQNKAISEVTINGKVVKWDRGRVTMTLKPGENNIGAIMLAPERFK